VIDEEFWLTKMFFSFCSQSILFLQ
jgi:hypothetical protein